MVDHYFSPSPESLDRPTELTLFARGISLKFLTSSSLFSKSQLDLGSKLLIESAIIKPNWKVLDLGCGYGPIGIFLAKKFPIKLFMSDINERAVFYSKKNADLNHIQSIVLQSDCLNNLDSDFDAILLNPPQTAGKQLCLKMISESILHLKPKGIFQLVARTQKGGKTLAKHMESVFGNVKVIGRGSGFSVWVSEKSA